MNMVKAFEDGQKIDRNSELSMRSRACLTRANTHLTCLYDHFVSATLQSHTVMIPWCVLQPSRALKRKMFVEIEED